MARLYRLFLISSSVALPCRCKFASLSKFVKKKLVHCNLWSKSWQSDRLAFSNHFIPKESSRRRKILEIASDSLTQAFECIQIAGGRLDIRAVHLIPMLGALRRSTAPFTSFRLR